MRKIIVVIVLSAAFILSGVSTTTYSSGQLTASVWADSSD